MFRKSLLAYSDIWALSVDFLDASKREAHDQWFFFLPSCLGSIAYIHEPLALYRRHGGNVTGLKNTAGFRKKWDNLRATNLAGIHARELSAARRAAILDRISAGTSDTLSRRAADAAVRYRQFAHYYRLRQALYRESGFFSRMRRLLALLAAGGYRPREQWGVGRKALVRDLICGWLFPIRPEFQG